MRRFISARPSPAMAVAFIALLAALSGTATALQGKNTVDSGDLKNGAVKNGDIANNAVNGKKVKDGSLASADVKNGSLTGTDITDNSLTGGDIDESTVGQVPSANTANSASTANTAASAAAANRATSAGSVDTFQPYSRVVAATPGADFMTALLAAPEIALAERGAFAIYGKCFKDVGDSVVFSLTFIRTSVNGSVLDSDHFKYSGNPFLDSATPEGFRSLSSSSVQFPDSADYTAGHAASQPNTDWQAMAPGGSAVMGSAGNGAKQGNLPGGNGIYGAGDACLFSGFLAG